MAKTGIVKDFNNNEYFDSIFETFSKNTSTRIPLCMCIDTSSSMQGRIRDVHEAIVAFLENQDKNTLSRDNIKLQIITFDDEVRFDPVCSFEYCEEKYNKDDGLKDIIEQFRSASFRATGSETNLGLAVEKALECIDKYTKILIDNGKMCVRPILMLFTDGYSTDPDRCKQMAEEIRKRRENGLIKVVCIGLGEEENVLNRFSENGKTDYTLNDEEIQEFFLYMSRQISVLSKQQIMTGSETLDIKNIWKGHH